MNFKNATCIADLREIARRRVPRIFFEYCENGSYSETTLVANRRALGSVLLRQRVMVDVSNRSHAIRILGKEFSLPIVIAPTGLTGMFYRDGEIAGAQAAARAGIPFTLSTMSICSIEDVAAASHKPFWFQLYFMKDREFTRSLIDRAKKAGCDVLVLTVDLQVTGQRHRDIRNGLSVPPRATVANLLDIARKPAWLAGMLAGKRRTFGNLHGWVSDASGMANLAKWSNDQLDPSLSWKDVEWIRSIWPGKLLVKGILDPADARSAVESGADGIVVSNHGGRQLDGTCGTAAIIGEIAEEVGAQTEILFDGGIRTGADIVRAIALGATAVMIGRAFLYGLAAGGLAGVEKAVDLLKRELDVAMALTGCKTIADIDRNVILSPQSAKS